MTLFFTDMSLLILHDVYATFEKIEKINNFEKIIFFFWKNFAFSLFRKISREFTFANSRFQKTAKSAKFSSREYFYPQGMF